MREQVILRDRHCVFPWCGRDARRSDLDHTIPYVPPDEGGPPGQTDPQNLAPLCRRHHRAKTFTGWTYQRPATAPTTWTSPHGHTWTVGPDGTTPLRARPHPPPRTEPRRTRSPPEPSDLGVQWRAATAHPGARRAITERQRPPRDLPVQPHPAPRTDATRTLTGTSLACRAMQCPTDRGFPRPPGETNPSRPDAADPPPVAADEVGCRRSRSPPSARSIVVGPTKVKPGLLERLGECQRLGRGGGQLLGRLRRRGPAGRNDQTSSSSPPTLAEGDGGPGVGARRPRSSGGCGRCRRPPSAQPAPGVVVRRDSL